MITVDTDSNTDCRNKKYQYSYWDVIFNGENLRQKLSKSFISTALELFNLTSPVVSGDLKEIEHFVLGVLYAFYDSTINILW